MLKSNGFLLFFSCLVISCENSNSTTLDLTIQPDGLEVFAPGIISTPLYERDITISPSGDELIFTAGDYRQNIRCLVQLKKHQSGWGPKTILSFSGTHQDIEPSISPDGQQLFFASTRPVDADSTRGDYNIWMSKKINAEWAVPTLLNKQINTVGDQFYPSVSHSGNLYFTATRKDGIGREDIFMSQRVNGEYQTPVPLDTMINTETYEFNAYVSPDENLIVFSSYGREDDMGGGDLYFSKKDEKGAWVQSINLQVLNSDKLDYCPFIDIVRGNFYFTSERQGKSKTIRSIDDLEAQANQVQNGFGDIYCIALDQLNL
ncbi:MAG: PD40 domain-containing protein [Saprospiraceae bacterium]|nr:PD40 domain-containing protein [Saprospiraceae bacterium]